MTKDAQEAIVSTFRFLEDLYGKYPTNDEVLRIIRKAKHKVQSTEAHVLLAKFRQKKYLSAVRPRSNDGPIAVPEIPREGLEEVGNGSAPELPTCVGVVPSPSPIPVATQPPLFAEEGSEEEQPEPRGGPKPEHLLLDAVLPLVRPHLSKITPRRWRQENVALARDLCEFGVTPERAARSWRDAQHDGETLITLKALRWYMGKQDAARALEPKYEHVTNAMMDAAGFFEDARPWGRQPSA